MSYILVRSPRLSVTLQVKPGGQLVVRAPHLYPKYLIDRFVQSKARWVSKQLAKQRLPQQPLTRFCTDSELKALTSHYVAHYCSLMSLSPRSLRYKNVRTYWGSCSPSGIISFNLRLAYTSAAAVEYVVVHELAHLRWRGHGVRFWELVKKHYPKTNEIRRHLRQFSRG